MVEFLKQSRPRGDTVRPAMSLEKDTWEEFKFIYIDKNVRDGVISKLLSEHLTVKNDLK